MTDICPEIILRAAIPNDENFSPSTVKLLDSPHTANLKRIVCNVLEPVLLRLLVCKDEKLAQTPDTSCPYPEHQNREAAKLVCNNSEIKLAQIYLRHDKMNPKARSCLIIFVKGCYTDKTDDILERFRNSVTLLGIAQEKPYFYIFCYDRSMCDNTVFYSCKKIGKELKEAFSGYSEEEDICIPASVSHGSEVLFIRINRTKFSLNAG
jgi:hypothetical protein